MKRSFGVLMPIFSLPSKYGVGDFGSESYKFIDFLEESVGKFYLLFKQGMATRHILQCVLIVLIHILLVQKF